MPNCLFSGPHGATEAAQEEAEIRLADAAAASLFLTALGKEGSGSALANQIRLINLLFPNRDRREARKEDEREKERRGERYEALG